MRCSFQRFDRERFTWGAYASVHSVIDCMLITEFPVITSKILCMSGHQVTRPLTAPVQDCFLLILNDNPTSLQGHIDSPDHIVASRCRTCRENLVRRIKFASSPGILAFDVTNNVTAIDHILQVPVDDHVSRYQLRGVVYHATDHFTARIITLSEHVWFHDGIATGSSMEYEGPLADFGDLTVCGATVIRQHASVAVYVLVDDN